MSAGATCVPAYRQETAAYPYLPCSRRQITAFPLPKVTSWTPAGTLNSRLKLPEYTPFESLWRRIILTRLPWVRTVTAQIPSALLPSSPDSLMRASPLPSVTATRENAAASKEQPKPSFDAATLMPLLAGVPPSAQAATYCAGYEGASSPTRRSSTRTTWQE